MNHSFSQFKATPWDILGLGGGGAYNRKGFFLLSDCWAYNRGPITGGAYKRDFYGSYNYS